MPRSLDVYLHNVLVGNLIQDPGGQMVFEYGENWLNAPGAAPLSHSLPLRKKRFTRKECRGFFAGIHRIGYRVRNSLYFRFGRYSGTDLCQVIIYVESF